MKKILFTILLLGLSVEFVISQAFEARLIMNSIGYLEYQMRETTGVNPPSQSTPITDITFVIRWSTSLGDPLEINKLCTQYNIVEGFPSAQTQDGYYYKLFGCEPIPVYPPPDTAFWTQNAWQTIASMKITNPSSGTGDFEIAPVGFISTDINFTYAPDGINVQDFTPTINGSLTAYPFPTFVYDMIWVGLTNRWDLAGNWSDGCGGVGSVPTNTQNVIIPVVDLANYVYPTSSNVNMTCRSLTIAAGANMLVRGGATTGPKTLTVAQQTIINADATLEFQMGNATNQSNGVLNTIELKPSAVRAGGQLIINPYSKVTATGATSLSSPSQIRILANTNSVGSFIDNGTITYAAGASADVQTYIKNSASPGSFSAHLVGPTVNDPAFQTANGYTGVYLSAFDLIGLGTYAYQYAEPSNSWTNIYSPTAPVKTARGIMLSTTDATNHTLTMTGQLITGNVSSANLQFGTNNLDLLSNPYPSSLDFSLFYTANSANITNKYQVYNPATGAYLFFITTGGGTLTKNIQVGQGFFVETLNTSPAAASFTNSMRLHSTAGFLKDDYPYQLRLDLAGNGFSDATFIFFKPEGTWGYDQLHDVYKWWSMTPEAAEIWTVDHEQSLLSMNSIPPLESGMVSIPMNFKCGAEADYTISAENIQSFDNGTEIYLEDLETGA